MWLSIPPSGQLRGVNVHSSGHYFAQYYFCFLCRSIGFQEKLFNSLTIFLVLLSFFAQFIMVKMNNKTLQLLLSALNTGTRRKNASPLFEKQGGALFYDC